ncbi:MAG TPA: D-alanine--D-alanine ligase [Candidatus Omnitrophota bacterium]|nr:D-alanine--D-alanine ligase [Candidatus Omnitrophota bacterium]
MDKVKGKKIGVLAGGCSSERDVSLRSGKAVFDALSKAGIDTVFVDIKDESLSFLRQNMFDVAFIALHGKFGEDGTIQAMFEERNIPYTGSGSAASRTALDKIASKRKFEAAGISVPRCYFLDEKGGYPADIKYPCVVKPQYEGSSVGLTIVNSGSGMEGAIEKAKPCGGRVMIEEFIEGRELTVGILRDKALPVVEIVAVGGVYDFNAKYKATTTKYIAPADLDQNDARRAQDLAERAHNALGCRSFSRVDIRMKPDGAMYVLEVNTIPGLTERSLLPMAAKAAGLDFTGLCGEILLSALK